MAIQMLYKAEIEFGDKVIEEMTFAAPKGADIVEYIEARMTKSYKILKILRKRQCLGCWYESLSQLDHMTHPDGCLHTSCLCDYCD